MWQHCVLSKSGVNVVWALFLGLNYSMYMIYCMALYRDVYVISHLQDDLLCVM